MMQSGEHGTSELCSEVESATRRRTFYEAVI